MFSTFKSRRDREEEKKRSEENAKKASSRELNPNLRSESAEKKPSRPNSFGSASWLRKAFKRAQERADREGRTIEEVAKERWGSLDTYYQLLREAEESGRSRSRSPEPYSGRYHRQIPSRRKESKFSRPRDDDDDDDERRYSSYERKHSLNSSWKTEERRKKDCQPQHQKSFSKSIPFDKEEKSSASKSIPTEKEEQISASKSISTDKEEKISTSKEEKIEKIYTEKELNALGAKIIKAEILGNHELANKLKNKLEKAKALVTASSTQKEEEVVILTKTDSRGNERPLDSSTIHSERYNRKSKKSKPQTHDKDGHREHYFPDDKKHDLKTLFMQEKSGSSEDQAETLSRLSGKRIKERMNEDFDIDDLFVSRASKASIEKDSAREKDRAIADHLTLTKSLDHCRYCLKSSSFSKHLIIATGKKCCLILPHNMPLTEGHCLIVPLSHVSCATIADEDIVEEVQEFRKTLVAMFKNEYDSADVVFFETVMGLKRYPHMVIEAVPIPNSDADDALMVSPAIYFQKAIQECETEWSMNKKLIHLGNKGLKRSIPKGLPYFHVDFGLENGFAHVIEDEDNFSKKFAHEIIGGMLDLDHRRWKSKSSESFEEQRNRVLDFGAKWHKYDFTL